MKLADMALVRVAVVGHVEWLHFARVEAVPRPGQIVHADEWWEEPAGGGAVAAVQLKKLAGEAAFYTALGDDDLGHRADRELREDHGVRVEAVFRPVAQRRAFTVQPEKEPPGVNSVPASWFKLPAGAQVRANQDTPVQFTVRVPKTAGP